MSTRVRMTPVPNYFFRCFAGGFAGGGASFLLKRRPKQPVMFQTLHQLIRIGDRLRNAAHEVRIALHLLIQTARDAGQVIERTANFSTRIVRFEFALWKVPSALVNVFPALPSVPSNCDVRFVGSSHSPNAPR